MTTSGLTVLDAAGRERELSRMFAGMEESETALAHARELLEAAGEPPPDRLRGPTRPGARPAGSSAGPADTMTRW